MGEYAIFIPVILFTILGFWRHNAIAFMIAGGLAIITGLEAPDIISSTATTTPLDIAIAMGFLLWALACWGYSFMCMFEQGYQG